MSRVLMLVGAQGAVLGETRVDGDDPQLLARAEALLREEALVSGFSDAEVEVAHLSLAGDPPNQP